MHQSRHLLLQQSLMIPVIGCRIVRLVNLAYVAHTQYGRSGPPLSDNDQQRIRDTDRTSEAINPHPCDSTATFASGRPFDGRLKPNSDTASGRGAVRVRRASARNAK